MDIMDRHSAIRRVFVDEHNQWLARVLVSREHRRQNARQQTHEWGVVLLGRLLA
jgi:hypothetical protein